MFIVVGVTGGIAAYKSVQLVRLLVEDGHEVHVVPTEDALRFVGRPMWEAISRHPVTTSVHDDVPTVRHVALGQRADLVIVAPATAHTLARMAAGLADDLLGTTLLATTAPIVVAPAMHTEMWAHAATQHNIGVLRERGVHVLGPAEGRLTGRDSGPGRMVEPDAIARDALAIVRPTGTLEGRRIVVTTGGTREPIDPVRFLGNRSSGRQGAALAVEAARRGAHVDLIAAHTDDGVLTEASALPTLTLHRAPTAAELAETTRAIAAGADAVVMAAAVADYRVAERSEQKIAKDASPEGRLTLELVETEDILAALAAENAPGRLVVGFAAETATGEALRERAAAKRRRKGAHLLVVNEVGWERGFESGENEVFVLDAADEVVAEARGTKAAVAAAVLDAVERALPPRG